jgi:glucosamine 6-phosphate synthetase-like amidotransferase/phosphosugar isomerase protein
VYRDLETFLHGHLAGVDDRTGLVAILVDRRSNAERAGRGRQLLAAARELAMPAIGIVSQVADAFVPASLTPAGRILVADAPSLSAATAALVGTAVPLQLLTERLARARGRNPDPIRRDEPAYLAAAAATE